MKTYVKSFKNFVNESYGYNINELGDTDELAASDDKTLIDGLIEDATTGKDNYKKAWAYGKSKQAASTYWILEEEEQDYAKGGFRLVSVFNPLVKFIFNPGRNELYLQHKGSRQTIYFQDAETKSKINSKNIDNIKTIVNDIIDYGKRNAYGGVAMTKTCMAAAQSCGNGTVVTINVDNGNPLNRFTDSKNIPAVGDSIPRPTPTAKSVRQQIPAIYLKNHQYFGESAAKNGENTDN